MQKSLLTRHPDTPCDAIERIDVEVVMQPSGMEQITFRIRGDLALVVLPPALKLQRQDELWRHTCCEVFVGSTDALHYCEFNFAPSCAWAAYRFDSYRAGMANAPVSTPRLVVTRTLDVFELIAVLDLQECVSLRSKMRLGLSCVIEEQNGRVSYWAVAHPPGKPDFHHADNFCLTKLVST